MKTQKIFEYPVFALGFRPFFALAGLSALILILLWNGLYKGQWSAANYYAPTIWHAHEMLFGYSTAVIAGFLLTAVRNWTGRPTVSGNQLAGLCMLWLYGRIVPFYAGMLPDMLIALVDLAFLPLLAFYLSKPMLESQQYRHLIFTGLLLLLAYGNGLVHSEVLGFQQESANIGLQLVIGVIVVLILVIAGRVFPFFTERGLPGTIAIRNSRFDQWSIGSAVLVFGLMMIGVSGTLLALPALFAAIVNIARIAGWYVPRIWYVPLLWVLYTGYGWLVLGFVLTALSAYAWVQPSLALHAFTLGGIGVLTLGMMSRVSLGHTGRALKASNAIAIGFLAINLAALIRIILPIAVPAWYQSFVYVSTFAWLAAFSLFTFVYFPMLVTPRVDGKEG